MPSLGRAALSILLVSALALPLTAQAAAADEVTAQVPPPLVITEIMADNAGTPGDQDYFEFFEVHNTTDAAIDLADHRIRYYNAVWLTIVEEGTEAALDEVVIPAGGTAVFWLRYPVGSGDATVTQWELDETDFRAHYGDAASTYPIHHVIGQSGFANSGARQLRIFDESGATIISESHYNRALTDRGRSDHFTLPATGAVLQDPVAGEPTPGLVDPAQLVRPDPEPEIPGVRGTDGNADAVSPLVITEIAGDNPGADQYEFLELTNTTDQPIDLAAAGIQLRYHTSQWNAGTVQPLIHLEGEDDSPAVIPAGGIAVFWMNYGPGDARRDLTKAQFRSFYGIDQDVPVFRFGNQAGVANAGNRGFSVTDATGTITRAWVPADDGDSGTPWNAQFAVPDLIGSTDARLVAYTHAGDIAPSPGAITLDQVTSALDRPSDPELAGAPILQITELAPDTANVSGSDAYEFVEIYNASDAPVNWGDYTLNYIYTDNALSGPVMTSSTGWPSTPSDVVIAPGKTLVAWVKNPAVVSAGLTVADFNAAMGSELVLGETIVELYTGGMSNGGSRGIQVATNTGHDLSRAYYFADDQTTPSTAIQYAWNPAAGGLWTPTPADATVQTLQGLAAPTPGSVSAAQVPGGLVPAPAAGDAPVIEDLTGGDEAPETSGVDFAFRVTDDVLVRTVRLSIRDNLGATDERLLTVSGTDSYGYSVPAADLYGKRWIEYTVTASDGAQTSTLGPVRVDLAGDDAEPLRLNLTEGQFVSGTVRVAATADEDAAFLALEVDGAPLAAPVPSLEAAPVFAFEATATDAFFRNGVKLGDDVLTIFDEGFYSRIETVDAAVPVDRVRKGDDLTLTITAGTKAWPEADVNENNDDFSAMNFRLALPDGRVLRPAYCETTREAGGVETAPAAYTCPTNPSTRVGFSDAGLVSLLLTFQIPDDAFDSIAASWDTTAVADGAHVVTAAAAGETVSRTVQVDNTAPALTTGIVPGGVYRGSFTINASATDAGVGVDSVAAALDGESITLPYSTSSLVLEPGEHVLVVTATDAAGNVATRDVPFRSVDEQPHAAPVGPADGESAEEGSVTLEALVDSPEGDLLTVSFREGYAFVPTDAEITAAQGTTAAARDTAGDGTLLSAEQLAQLVGVDGITVDVSSDTALPYQLFTVAVPEDAGDGAQVRASWTGSANADARVTLYALRTDGGWARADEQLTAGEESFELTALVPVEGFATDGVVTLLVQHSEGFANAPRSSRDAEVTLFHPEATPRSEYDFTVAWESDTQYYNRNEGSLAGTGGSDVNYGHQLSIHDFLLAERDNLNLAYLVHTGDIVDDAQYEYQWQNADAAYRMLDEAGLPYGVLAGNHDVHGGAADYTEYGQVFGEARFAGNPWYGGSYKNNRGHYDLISAGGLDLLVLYMGWPDNVSQMELNSQDIAWMNEVIAAYPERKVWINLHEYMLTTGGLGPFPQRVLDEVVATNPNVFAVGSGHYHDAYTRLDDFDDDGDGVADRTVTSMLFDYQGLPEGGQGFLRLLHFDNVGERIMVRTYSPSLEDFDSDEPSLNNPPGMQEFEIPYARAGLAAQTKTLSADAFRAEVLTTKEIGTLTDVESGTTVSAPWSQAAPGQHGWYVVATGPHGGEHASVVSTLTVTETDDSTGGEDGTGEGGTGEDSDLIAPTEDDLTDDTRDGVRVIGSTTLVAGEPVLVEIDESHAERTMHGWLFSDPVALGSGTVDAQGRITLRVPADAQAGPHRLVIADAEGTVIGWTEVTVERRDLPATGAELPWGIAAAALILLLAGAWLVILRRRRVLPA